MKHKKLGWCIIYILIEFQSQIDPWMPVRVMVYIGLLYQTLIKSGVVKHGEKLPPVVPIVIYNGEKPWNAVQNIYELIHKISADLDTFIPKVSYYLIYD